MTGTSPLPRTNMLKRIFCISISPPPSDPGCYEIAGDVVTIDLSRSPELQPMGGALRIDDERLPDRILVLHASDGQLRAFRNRCACGGFRIDPVPGEDRMRCITPMQSTCDFTGKPVAGPAEKNLDVLDVRSEGQRILVDVGSIRGMEPPHARKDAAA